jgi:hypothetical protein
MSQITQLTKIPLAGTKKGVISVSNVSEPYGTGTPDVVSIGIALNGEDVEWKAHIPYDNIDELVKALLEAKANK